MPDNVSGEGCEAVTAWPVCVRAAGTAVIVAYYPSIKRIYAAAPDLDLEVEMDGSDLEAVLADLCDMADHAALQIVEEAEIKQPDHYRDRVVLETIRRHGGPERWAKRFRREALPNVNARLRRSQRRAAGGHPSPRWRPTLQITAAAAGLLLVALLAGPALHAWSARQSPWLGAAPVVRGEPSGLPTKAFRVAEGDTLGQIAEMIGLMYGVEVRVADPTLVDTRLPAIDERGRTVVEAVEAVCRAANLRVRYEEGAYVISPR